MKNIFVSILSLTLSSTLFAQHAEFGLKAGLNIANTTNDYGDPTNARASVNAGGLVHIHITREFALQPEFLFSGQGGKYTARDGEHNLVLNYVNIPVLAQYMFAGGFRLETGPQLGFLVSAKDKLEGMNTGEVTSADFRNVDFSWAFGLGYLTGSNLGVDLRYNLGVSNINQGSEVIRNSVFQIGVFYQFRHTQYSHTRYTHTHYRSTRY